MLLVPIIIGVASLVRTPFGEVVDPSCVVRVPTHTLILREDSQGLLLSHPDRGTWLHKTPANCTGPARPSTPHASITCDKLPCNNWIDNAGWQQPAGATPLGGFRAKYLVPSSPTKRGPGQILFYFIGAENTDGQPRHGQPPPSGRAILQPVLTFDPDGWCKASKTGWCFASWYCCPKNLTVHSDYVLDVQPWDSFDAFFNYTAADDEFLVSGTSAASGKSASLRCPRQGRSFNWADATLEVYQITECALFSPARMSFSDVHIWDVHGKELTPTWTLSPESPCGGSIIVDPELYGAVHIGHEATGVKIREVDVK